MIDQTHETVILDFPCDHASVIGPDCTNGGVTSGKDSIRLGEDLALVVDFSAPWIVRHGYLGILQEEFLYYLRGLRLHAPSDRVVRMRAVPIIDGEPKSGIFGGRWIMSSDVRFPAEGPIPVFDRFE